MLKFYIPVYELVNEFKAHSKEKSNSRSETNNSFTCRFMEIPKQQMWCSPQAQTLLLLELTLQPKSKWEVAILLPFQLPIGFLPFQCFATKNKFYYVSDDDLLKLRQSQGRFAKLLSEMCKFYRDFHVRSDGVYGNVLILLL